MVKRKLGVKGLSFLLFVKGPGSLFTLMALFSSASNCINGFININIALSDSSKMLSIGIFIIQNYRIESELLRILSNFSNHII